MTQGSEHKLVTVNDGPDRDTIEATDDVVEMIREKDKREMVIPLDSVDWDLTQTPGEVTVAGETDEVTRRVSSAGMEFLGDMTGRKRQKQGYGPWAAGARHWIAEWEERTGVEWDEPEIFNYEVYRLRFGDGGVVDE